MSKPMTSEEVTTLIEQLNLLVSGNVVVNSVIIDACNVENLQDNLIDMGHQLGKRASALFVGIEVSTLDLTQERDRLYLLQETLRIAEQLCDKLISVIELAQRQLRAHYADLIYRKQALEEAK